MEVRHLEQTIREKHVSSRERQLEKQFVALLQTREVEGQRKKKRWILHFMDK